MQTEFKNKGISSQRLKFKSPIRSKTSRQSAGTTGNLTQSQRVAISDVRDLDRLLGMLEINITSQATETEERYLYNIFFYVKNEYSDLNFLLTKRLCTSHPLCYRFDLTHY